METTKNKQDYLTVPCEVTVIAKNAGIVFILIISGGFLAFIFRILSARYLGPELFGVFFLGISLIGILERIAVLGVNNGVLRYASIAYGASNNRTIKGVIVAGVKIVLVWGFIISAATFLFSGQISVKFFRNEDFSLVLKIFSFEIIFFALTDVFTHSLQALKQPKYKEFAKRVVEPGAGIIFLLIVMIFGYKLIGAILAYVLGIITATIFSFRSLIQRFPYFIQNYDYKRFSAAKMLNFSWPLLFVGFLTYFMQEINTLFLGHFYGAVSIAIYAGAYQTAFLIVAILTSFIAIFAPIMADLHHKNEMGKLAVLFKIVTKWIFTISFALFLIIVLLSKEIMWLWGAKYMAGWLNLVIIGFAQLVNCTVGPTGNLIMMSGRSRLNLLNVCVMVLVTLIFSYFLVPRYADLGAAISMALAIILINLITLIEVIWIFKFQPYRIDFWKPLFSGIVAFFIINAAQRIFMFEATIAKLLVVSLSFSFLYIFMLVLFGIEEEDKLILEKTIAKFSIKR